MQSIYTVYADTVKRYMMIVLHQSDKAIFIHVIHINVGPDRVHPVLLCM